MGDFKGRHILDTEQLETEEIIDLMDLAEDLQKKGPEISKLAEGNLGTLFRGTFNWTRLSLNRPRIAWAVGSSGFRKR